MARVATSCDARRAIRSMRGAVTAGLLLPLLLWTGAAYADPSPAPRRPAAGSTSASPGAEADRAAFGIAPATNGKPDERPNLSYSVTPGGQQLDQVAVVNIGMKPLTLRLYATDAKTTSNGLFDLLPGNEKPKGAGSWIALANGKKAVSVAARSRVIVPLRLRVPHNADPGDHTGGVVVSLATEAKNAKGDAVTLEQRVAVRLRIRVSGELKPKLVIENMTARYAKPLGPWQRGTMRVTYTIRNTGNVRLMAKQRLKVSGWLGASATARDLVDVPELLPGSAFEVSSVVRGVRPAMRLTATATVVPVGRSEDVNPDLTSVSNSVGVWAITWGLLALLALLIVGSLRWRRRRRMRYDAAAAPGRPAATERVVPADSVPKGALHSFTRRSAPAVLAAVAAALLAQPSAHAAEGGLTVLPEKGVAITPLTVVTTGACPAGDFVVAKLFGKGFPEEGENVVAVSAVGIYPKSTGGGLEIPLQNHLQAFADRQVPAASLTGRYDLVVSCRGKLNAASLGEFRGSVWFTTPTEYRTGDPQAPAGRKPAGEAEPRAPQKAAAAPSARAALTSAAPSAGAARNGAPADRAAPLPAEQSFAGETLGAESDPSIDGSALISTRRVASGSSGPSVRTIAVFTGGCLLVMAYASARRRSTRRQQSFIRR